MFSIGLGNDKTCGVSSRPTDREASTEPPTNTRLLQRHGKQDQTARPFVILINCLLRALANRWAAADYYHTGP